MVNSAIKRPDGKILKIRTIGDRILRENSKIVADFDGKLEKFVNDMFATMYACEGIGLAAPQVGKSLKIVVIDVSPCLAEGETCELDGENVQDIAATMPLCLINPVVERYSTEICNLPEGCLSIPNFDGHVRRPREITLNFVDVKNVAHTLACNGILARCAQHEIDHLSGKLYTDSLAPKDKKRFAKYLAERSDANLPERDDGNVGAANDFQS